MTHILSDQQPLKHTYMQPKNVKAPNDLSPLSAACIPPLKRQAQEVCQTDNLSQTGPCTQHITHSSCNQGSLPCIPTSPLCGGTTGHSPAEYLSCGGKPLIGCWTITWTEVHIISEAWKWDRWTQVAHILNPVTKNSVAQTQAQKSRQVFIIKDSALHRCTN